MDNNGIKLFIFLLFVLKLIIFSSFINSPNLTNLFIDINLLLKYLFNSILNLEILYN